MRRTRFVVTALVIGASVSRAFAQTPAVDELDRSKPRVHIGPLFLNPTMALTNLGVDTNVFNEPDAAAPKRDFTLTLTPQTDLWMGLGRTRISGNIKVDFVWFQKYSAERSANSSYTLAWRVPLNRIAFSASGNRLSTRDRPGFEIDARSQRYETGFRGGAELRAMSKTFIGIRGEWRKVAFDKAAVFLGTSLQNELNRTVRSGALTLRHQMTPLTAITIAAARETDRFEHSPLRDTNSTMYSATVSLDPFALIKGSATLGYRDFKPLSAGVPRYQGAMADIDLSYTLLGMTRFDVQGIRDPQYSYDINQPYYVLTGINGTLTQHIFGPVDLVARVGAQRLDYRNRAGIVDQLSNRTDRVHTYGGGVGYRLGRRVRVGLNIDEQTRTSGIARRRYKGLRYGTSVTYGL